MKTGRATIYPVNMEDPGDGAENLFFFKPSEPVLDAWLPEISGNWTSANLVIKFPIWNASSSIYNILSLGGSPVENQQFGSRASGFVGPNSGY